VVEKIDISRIGCILELDPTRIEEVIEKGRCTLVSPKLFNKGVYKVKNSRNNQLEDVAVNITKIEAATYKGLVDEFGAKCVDAHLWEEVPEGSVIFFYSFNLETDLVEYELKPRTEYIEA
jgi:hypothetical protein